MLFFFFFQAEDGIRDLTVTGVQTCALPILNVLLLQGRRARTRPSPAIRYCCLMKRVVLLSLAAALLALSLAAAPNPVTTVIQIGRASCRERVEISVVAVAVKKKTGR